LPQEHMTSDPKNVSLTTVGTLSWNFYFY
jgi:hypothetical protein